MANQRPTPRLAFIHMLEENRPQAVAWVRGNNIYPQISGLVKFYDTPYGGVLVDAEVFGLPDFAIPGATAFYGFHIHQFGDCSQGFTKTGGHYNPTNNIHPQHAGDFPPLLGNQGYAWSSFYDKRFRVKDIMGRSVIIHADRDDFTTQPSGDSGDMIACGVIMTS